MGNMRSINRSSQKSAGLTLRFVVARENGEEAKLGPQITMVEKHVPMLTDLNQHRTTKEKCHSAPKNGKAFVIHDQKNRSLNRTEKNHSKKQKQNVSHSKAECWENELGRGKASLSIVCACVRIQKPVSAHCSKGRTIAQDKITPDARKV